jgi:hypothetical protein
MYQNLSYCISFKKCQFPPDGITITGYYDEPQYHKTIKQLFFTKNKRK